MKVPPVRERAEDLPLLLESLHRHVRRSSTRRRSIKFLPDAWAMLLVTTGPATSGKLKNLVERLTVRSAEAHAPVTVADLPTEIRRTQATPSAAAPIALRTSTGELLYQQMVQGRQSFWTVVYASVHVAGPDARRSARARRR